MSGEGFAMFAYVRGMWPTLSCEPDSSLRQAFLFSWGNVR